MSRYKKFIIIIEIILLIFGIRFLVYVIHQKNVAAETIIEVTRDNNLENVENKDNVLSMQTSKYSENEWCFEKNVTDLYGSLYEKCAIFKYHYYFYESTFDSKTEIALNRDYKEFKGIVFSPGTDCSNTRSEFSIFANGKVIYSEVIEKSLGPVNIDVEIPDQTSFLTFSIRYISDDNDNEYCELYLTDAYLYY